jgi:hypothetical protein
VDDLERRALGLLEPGAATDRVPNASCGRRAFVAAFREFERRSVERGEGNIRLRLIAEQRRRSCRHVMRTSPTSARSMRPVFGRMIC